ncbi:MAG: glycosyltransferase [Tepidisphaeraceae bacterium]
MTLMGFNATLFCASAVIGLLLTPLVMMLAKSFSLVDQPHVRKVHTRPVPRIGGVAIMAATVLPLLVIATTQYEALKIDSIQPALTLIVGSVSLAIIGLLDDLFDIPSKYKLLALLAASAAFCGAGGTIENVTVNGNHLFGLGLASWPVTMLWIVLVTVSINFIDGLDGLAAGIVMIAAGVLAVGGAVGHDVQGVLIAVALVGSTCAFLFYNTRPARIFMGDSGSMFLGFTLASACVLATPKAGTTRGLLLPALALSIPLVDTALTMVRRGVLDRRSLFAAERGHVHHRLMDTGLAHGHVVILLHSITLAAAGVAVISIFSGYVTTITAIGVFLFGLAMLFRMAGSVRARDTLGAIRRNRAIGREAKRYQAAFYDLQLRFREVQDFNGWWKLVCRAGEVFDFGKIDLPLVRRDGSESTLKWRRNDEPVADAQSITAEVPIPQRRADVTLRAAIEVMIVGSLESGGHRVALFSRLMSEFGLNQICYHSGPATRKASPATDAAAAVPAAVVPGALPGVKIAIVHDFLYTYAGAERVVEQMLKTFPQADLFSLFDFLPEKDRGFLGGRPVQTSFLQKLPLARRKHRAYLPLMPLAIEQLDVSQYDLVLSSSYVAAKGVITRPDQLHVCYCHTPVRFAWDLQNQYLGQVGLKKGVRSLAAKMILHYIRTWDVRSANGVDVFLTNSDYVGRRIQKVYRRQSETVYPPVDTEFFSLCEEKENYYVTASRMVPYKRIDLIVEAFSQMPDKRLIVVGTGPEMDRIKAKAGPNITLVGHQPAETLRNYLQRAKAFVFAAEEDFGIAPVEAMACGTPVICFGRGGATESVIPGKTGVLFHSQTVADVRAAVETFGSQDWDSVAIRQHAESFSAARFREELAARIAMNWQGFENATGVTATVADPDGLLAANR